MTNAVRKCANKREQEFCHSLGYQTDCDDQAVPHKCQQQQQWKSSFNSHDLTGTPPVFLWVKLKTYYWKIISTNKMLLANMYIFSAHVSWHVLICYLCNSIFIPVLFHYGSIIENSDIRILKTQISHSLHHMGNITACESISVITSLDFQSFSWTFTLNFHTFFMIPVSVSLWWRAFL